MCSDPWPSPSIARGSTSDRSSGRRSAPRCSGPPRPTPCPRSSSYVVKRRVGSAGWTTVASSTTARSLKQTLTVGTGYRFGVAARRCPRQPRGRRPTRRRSARPSSRTARASRDTPGPGRTATSSSASNGKLHTTTRAGASVEFRTSARAIAIVGRKGPGRGQAKVYVDGVLVQTIDLYRSLDPVARRRLRQVVVDGGRPHRQGRGGRDDRAATRRHRRVRHPALTTRVTTPGRSSSSTEPATAARDSCGRCRRYAGRPRPS